jgi:type II secretory pathway component GspD/PulD (secretin)
MNKHRSIQFNRILTILLIICLSLPGTALGTPIGGKGKKNFETGKKYEIAQQWDEAAREFAQAVAADPGNPEYRLHLLKSLQNAALMFMKRGDELLQQNDAAGAYNNYRQAVSYDPTNELAKLKMERIIEQQKAAASGLEPVKINAAGNAMAGATVEIASKPQRPGELYQNVTYKDTKFKTLVQSIAGQLGLNVIMDETVKDSNVSLNLQNTTLPKALDNLLMMTKHTFEVIDRKTIFVYQDNPTNRQRYERLFFKTFYLGNANPEDVSRMVTQLLTGTAKQAITLKNQNALVVRASRADMQAIQYIINMLDKSRPEVVIDVEIYEVSQNNLTQIGNQLATTSTRITETIGKDKDGKDVTITRDSASLNNFGGVGIGRGIAGVLSSGISPIGGATFSPVLGGLGTILGLPPSSLSLLQSKGNTVRLDGTQVHALDGETNETKIGKKVPISLGAQLPGYIGAPVTTGTTTGTPGAVSGIGGLAGGLGGYPYGGLGYSSIQYQDVGLVIKVTPSISNDGTVQIKMDLTSSGVEQSATAEERLTPTITQRSLSTIARIPDGKTSVVAGVKQQSSGNTRTSIPVIGMVPILGRFFTAPRQESGNSDIIITVTPHIIRSAAINREDHLAHFIGTLGGGNNISIEAVVNQAQAEEEQERRMIAAEKRGQGEQFTPDQQSGSALLADTTAPQYNPQPKVEVVSGPIPTPSQEQVAGLTQPQRLSSGAPANALPAPTPAVANPAARKPVQNASVPPTQLNSNIISESGSSQNGSQPQPNTEDPQFAVPAPPETPVQPARLAPTRTPEAIEKLRRDEEAKAAKEREDAAKNPDKIRAEEARRKALEDEMIRQYMKEIPKAPKNVKPAAVQPAEKPKAQPGDQPAGKPDGAANEPANAPAEPGKPAAGVVELSMMPTTIKGQVGKSFIVVLALDGQASMTGASIALKYDPAMLQVKKVLDGGLLGKRPDITHQVDGGNLMISMQQAAGGPVKASGRLLIVEFTALSNGSTTIEVNPAETHLLMAGAPGAKISATPAQVQIGGEVASRLPNGQ